MFFVVHKVNKPIAVTNDIAPVIDLTMETLEDEIKSKFYETLKERELRKLQKEKLAI